MTDSEHNRQQESKAVAILQRAIADALRIDFRGIIGVRLAIRRKKIGEVRLLTDEEK